MEAYASHSLQDEGSSDSDFDDASKDDDASKEESDAEVALSPRLSYLTVIFL